MAALRRGYARLMRSPDDDRWDDEELEGRPRTRAEELAEELDIPLEEAEKIAREEGDQPETDLDFDALRFGGSE
jgi:hypothetical protein